MRKGKNKKIEKSNIFFQWRKGLNRYFFQKAIYCCLVSKSCLTLFDPMDCSPPGSSTHSISQTRILEQVAISFSRGSSQCRDQTHVSCFGRWMLYQWVTWEALSWFTHFLWWKLLQQLPRKGCMEGEFFLRSCMSELFFNLASHLI